VTFSFYRLFGFPCHHLYLAPSPAPSPFTCRIKLQQEDELMAANKEWECFKVAKPKKKT